MIPCLLVVKSQERKIQLTHRERHGYDETPVNDNKEAPLMEPS